jgi:hypothetical protein
MGEEEGRWKPDDQCLVMTEKDAYPPTTCGDDGVKRDGKRGARKSSSPLYF